MHRNEVEDGYNAGALDVGFVLELHVLQQLLHHLTTVQNDRITQLIRLTRSCVADSRMSGRNSTFRI